MLHNAAKANATIEELGWSLLPPGHLNESDGLTRWFINQANAGRTILNVPYFRQWLNAVNQNGVLTTL
jgi:hypothetical protein